ncbi:Fungal lipase-like domain [Dillenia turbinata]|uniref:Fungal lipase-like domain n=1 Tax=Dillenia turbinata TaxID=194707 RepID=A0AAN8ZN74_9MAGN
MGGNARSQKHFISFIHFEALGCKNEIEAELKRLWCCCKGSPVRLAYHINIALRFFLEEDLLSSAFSEPEHQRYLLAEAGDTLFASFIGTKQYKDVMANANILQGAIFHEDGVEDIDAVKVSDSESAKVGSESLANGQKPIKLMPKVVEGKPKPAAHRGFLACAKGIPALELYRLAQKKKRKLVLCGHSLGGAVAVLATLAILRVVNASSPAKESEKVQIKCITFSQPPVGNAALREYLTTTTRMHCSNSQPFLLLDEAKALGIPWILAITNKFSVSAHQQRAAIDAVLKAYRASPSFTEVINSRPYVLPGAGNTSSWSEIEEISKERISPQKLIFAPINFFQGPFQRKVPILPVEGVTAFCQLAHRVLRSQEEASRQEFAHDRLLLELAREHAMRVDADRDSQAKTSSMTAAAVGASLGAGLGVVLAVVMGAASALRKP